MIEVAFDIETVASPEAIERLPEVEPSKTLKDPEKILKDIEKKKAAQIEKMALSPLYGRVLSVDLYDGKDHNTMIAKEPKDEEDMLKNFWEDMAGDHYMISFNGKQFDLPFLQYISMKYGIENPMGHKGLEFKRYSHGWHYDLRLMLSHGDVTAKGTLKDYYWDLFGVDRNGISGADIGKLYLAEDWDRIEKHIQDDTEMTYEIWMKMRSWYLENE